jgi:PAS domain S-box-containing protein
MRVEVALEVRRARDQTDGSLCTERRKTDELLKTASATGRKAPPEGRPSVDPTVELQREHTDNARQNGEVPDNSEFVRALERERRIADDEIRNERARADEATRHLRDVGRAGEAAIARERTRTDRSLGHEREKADTLLTRLEVPFRLLVEQVRDYAIFMLGPGGDVISWNLGAERLYGYRYEEIVGKHFSLLFHEEDVKAGKPGEKLWIANRDGRAEEEARRVRKDGTAFMANVVFTALRTDEGELTGFAIVTRDVTELFTSAERELHRTEDTLRLTVEVTGLGTWDWDLGTDKMVSSDRCKSILGLAPTETMTYERFLDSLHPEDRRRTDEAVRRSCDPSTLGTYDIEYRVLLPDGSVRWVAARGSVIFASAGAERVARRFIGTVLDITPRKKIEEERERLVRDLDVAVKARDDFVAVLSHDLKGPLSSISLGAALLVRQLPDEMVGVRRRARTIQTAAERAGRMIEDLLQEIALQRGAVNISAEPHDARALVREVVAMFEADAAERHQSLTVEILGDLRPVRCNRDYVLRVFANLIGNAQKFTPIGGSIAIRAEPAGEFVKFSVSDTGPGIPPQQISHIFEPGFRGGSRGPGLGLGLAIASGIVRAHGGAIGVESEPGKGSTFWFTLPAS